MNKWFVIVAAISLLPSQTLFAEEDRSQYNAYFDAAAAEFKVPADVLKGIAFAETRWSHMTWAEGDTASSCTGMPRPYGIMGLWDNHFFGHSLQEAASLIRKTPDDLKGDPYQNIRGAAALLRKYYDAQPKPDGTTPTDIESWRNAIAAYSSLPQIELAQQHALDVYTHMTNGYHGYGIEWNARPVNLEPIRAAVVKIQQEALAAKQSKTQSLKKTTDQPDYPGAKWLSAADGHWYTTGVGMYFVVIHDMEGYYLPVLSYFQDPTTQASAHFCINGLQNGPGEANPGDRPAGEITQMVELKYWAWHVVCWNRYMIGIEHEGFVSNPIWYSDAMYHTSATLTAWLCNKFNIPKDRNHIIGHNQWQNSSWVSWLGVNWPAIDPTCNNHTDPGQYWKWDYYMGLVNGDSLPPKIASAFPGMNSIGVPAYKDIVIAFSEIMDTASTNASFSITPTVTGVKRWSSDERTFTFHPSTFLAFNTTYSVKVDSTAKNLSYGKKLDGAGNGTGGTPYTFSFTTNQIDTAGPVIVQNYPKANSLDIPVFAEERIAFNEPILSSSLTGKIQFQDSNGVNVPNAQLQLDSVNDQGVLAIPPVQLKPSTAYQIKLLAGLKDLYGNSTSSDVLFRFRTSPQSLSEGVVFDTFEANNRGWMDPVTVSGTVFVDSAATKFSIATDKEKGGVSSGKLTYGFTLDTGGTVVLQPLPLPTIDSYNSFGVWVYGDESGNEIRMNFQPDDQKFSFGTIDWRGWKPLIIPTSSISGTNRRFISIELRQASGASKAGVLYFDNMQLNAVVNGVNDIASLTPGRYSLDQNYPNPFNPSTTIRFGLPEESRISIIIYDLLGRKVASVADGNFHAGYYSLPFRGDNLASGVYLYRMTASTSGGQSMLFEETKKLLLLK